MKLKYFGAKLIDIMFIYVICSYLPQVVALVSVITYLLVSSITKTSIGDYVLNIKINTNILFEPAFYFSLSIFLNSNNIYINSFFVMVMIFVFIIGAKNIDKGNDE